MVGAAGGGGYQPPVYHVCYFQGILTSLRGQGGAGGRSGATNEMFNEGRGLVGPPASFQGD